MRGKLFYEKVDPLLQNCDLYYVEIHTRNMFSASRVANNKDTIIFSANLIWFRTNSTAPQSSRRAKVRIEFSKKYTNPVAKFISKTRYHFVVVVVGEKSNLCQGRMSSHVKPCHPGVTEDIAEILTLPSQPVQGIFFGVFGKDDMANIVLYNHIFPLSKLCRFLCREKRFFSVASLVN